MSKYLYKCPKCNFRQELTDPATERDPAVCPHCEVVMRRRYDFLGLVSGPGMPPPMQRPFVPGTSILAPPGSGPIVIRDSLIGGAVHIGDGVKYTSSGTRYRGEIAFRSDDGAEITSDSDVHDVRDRKNPKNGGKEP